MDDIITICIDGGPSMIGKKRICVLIHWRQKCVYCSLCFTSCKFGGRNISNRDLIAILQTVVSSVNKIRSRAFHDRLFQEASRDENFHRLIYSAEVRWLLIGSYLTRFRLLFDNVLDFFSNERHYSAEFTY